MRRRRRGPADRTCFSGEHVLVGQQLLNVRHGVVEVERSRALELPAVVIGPDVNPENVGKHTRKIETFATSMLFLTQVKMLRVKREV